MFRRRSDDSQGKEYYSMQRHRRLLNSWGKVVIVDDDEQFHDVLNNTYNNNNANTTIEESSDSATPSDNSSLPNDNDDEVDRNGGTSISVINNDEDTVFDDEEHAVDDDGDEGVALENNKNNTTDFIEYRDGYPIRYRCIEILPYPIDNYKLNTLHVDYEYELSFRRGTLKENLKAFESSLLHNVAKRIGLDPCDFGTQTSEIRRQTQESSKPSSSTLPLDRRRRRRLEKDSSYIQKSYILSLGSDNKDTINSEIVDCNVLNHKSDENIKHSRTCVPMSGSMSFLHTGDDSSMMTRFLLREIEDVMTMGKSALMVKDIKDVAFIPSRLEEDANLPPPSPQGGYQWNRMEQSILFVLMITLLASVIAIFAIAAFVSWRRKKGLKDISIQHVSTAEAEGESIGSSDSDYDFPADLGGRTGSFDEAISMTSSLTKEDNSIPTGHRYNFPSKSQQSLRKKRKTKSKTLSIPQRVSMAPNGIESIPEDEDEVHFETHLNNNKIRMDDDNDSCSSEDDEEMVAPEDSLGAFPVLLYPHSPSLLA